MALNKIPTEKTIASRLGKRRMEKIEWLEVQRGVAVVIDLGAKYPLENETTVCVIEINDEDTLAGLISEISYWIDGLEPKPDSNNWA